MNSKTTPIGHEEVFDLITEHGLDQFTSREITPHFPNATAGQVSSALAYLANKGIIFRLPRTSFGGKSYRMYSTEEPSEPPSDYDRTPTRGHDPYEPTEEVNRLKGEIMALELEVDKLQRACNALILALPNEKIIEILKEKL